MKQLKKLTLTLALLIAAVTSAWADSFSTEAYTADATLSAVSVTGNTTLTINEGVTVTVNNGLTISSGATLTVTGGGSLAVNGAKGANGGDGNYPGEAGSTAIGGSGQLAIANATITATGGAGGNGGFDEYSSQFGGEGGPAVSGVSISIQTGSLTAIGGAGGIGGESTFYHNKYPDGPAGNAFISFPNISDATLSYSTDNVTYTKYESGNTTLYRYMKVEPLDGPAVTIADGNGEASFKMPQYDLTATYTIKRDMTVDVAGEMADRIRIQMVGNAFQAVDATQMDPVVKDNLETNSPVTLTVTTDYTLQLQKQSDTNADQWTDVTALSVGTFRYKITGAGNYSGICYSEEFALFQGYEVTVPAGEYVTFYAAENLKVEDADAKLYTITAVNETAATATLSDPISVAPASTPLLVYNSNSAEKTFLLLPTDDGADNVTAADEFKGTLTATQIAASTSTKNNYAFNGLKFVWVKNVFSIGANKCWLEISTPASARTVKLVFGDATGIDSIERTEQADGDWYDLNGHKLQAAPKRKGVYIHNGRKEVVK